ncbi:MAG: hypothetical protein MEQ84_06200 [Mesorhizobium sp.]|nr:hypothetical protein [Mesorhizobium sp.]
MAPLPDSFKAFQFQTGLDRICEAYRASVATMEKSQREAQECYATYEASGEDDSEYDEDGILLHSTRHALDYDEMNATLAINVVREAFITSAFHYWERSARGWTGLYSKKDTYPALSKASAKRYAVCPKLEVLNTLNNLLKHSGSDTSLSLSRIRPDYFSPLFPEQNSVSHQRLRLRIKHEHVEEAFAIVRASGPTYDVKDHPPREDRC